VAGDQVSGPVNAVVLTGVAALVGLPYLGLSLGITAVALVAGGMSVGRLTGRPLLGAGLRQLLLGGVAVTFGVGSLIGSNVH